MASYRILGQFRQFFLDDGRVNDGGSIKFFESDLVTLKNTYSDKELTIPNPNPVPMDASGRLTVDCWGSGDYGSELRDGDNVILETLNFIQSGESGGLVIPPLSANKFLTNDGSIMSWQTIIQVPDPTGMDGNILYTDGIGPYWAPPPSVEIPDATSGAGFIKVGDYMFQWGTNNMTNSGTQISTVTFTFPIPFVESPNVTVTVNKGSGVVPAGFIGSLGLPATSSTQLTVAWDLNVDDQLPQFNLTTPFPFNWHAAGKWR